MPARDMMHYFCKQKQWSYYRDDFGQWWAPRQSVDGTFIMCQTNEPESFSV